MSSSITAEAPPAPAPGRKRSWRYWATVGCAVVLLWVALMGLLIFRQIRGAYAMSAEAEEAVMQFLQFAASGQIDRAYDNFSRELKAAKSLEEFRREVSADPEAFDVRETDFSDKWKKTLADTIEFDGTMTLRNGQRRSAQFVLGGEDGYWVIKSYRIGAGPAAN